MNAGLAAMITEAFAIQKQLLSGSDDSIENGRPRPTPARHRPRRSGFSNGHEEPWHEPLAAPVPSPKRRHIALCPSLVDKDETLKASALKAWARARPSSASRIRSRRCSVSTSSGRESVVLIANDGITRCGAYKPAIVQ